MSKANFHHIHLNVTDPDTSIAYYEKYFGAKKVKYRGKTDALFTEKSFLLFEKVEVSPKTHIGSSLWHIGWSGVDGQSEFDWRVKEGIGVHTPINPLGDSHWMYFFGPNKEVVEVMNALARKGCSLYHATELVNRKLKTPISTIRDMCSDDEMQYASVFMVQDYEYGTGERIPTEWIENLKKSGYYYKNVNYAYCDDDFLSAVRDTIERNKRYKELDIEPPPPEGLPF